MFLLLIIILFPIVASLWAFFIYVKSPPKIVSDITPARYGFSYEDISFVTKDNITLRGWFLPQQNQRGTNPIRTDVLQGRTTSNGAGTIVALHGWPADKGNIFPVIFFLSQKYNLFLFDFRALGKSEGKYSTVGAREQGDLLAAIEYLKSRDIDQIGVWGFSMGAAVALMTAPKAPEIQAVIAETSYASLDRMAPEAFRFPLIKYPLAYLTGVWAKLFLGIDMKSVSPVESAKHIDIPVLIIHSTNDEVIPFSHAELLKEALKDNPKAEFWFQDDLIHGQLSSEYELRIMDFFERNL